jgi:hypothetical protein
VVTSAQPIQFTVILEDNHPLIFVTKTVMYYLENKSLQNLIYPKIVNKAFEIYVSGLSQEEQVMVHAEIQSKPIQEVFVYKQYLLAQDTEFTPAILQATVNSTAILFSHIEFTNELEMFTILQEFAHNYSLLSS